MKIAYRPEIDGLRAIAVAVVILYHAQITILGHEPFKGGFIGVDIFFVISGYLITSIILKELLITGHFSFFNFYIRRVRRILPALLFVISVSILISYVVLLPQNLIEFTKSIMFSLGFSSNFYFYFSGQEYNGPNNLLLPFLHTWSLSVEEQYYILFPIVLLITFKYFKKNLIHIIILGFIISLSLADWTSRNYPSISFYFIHTRMWELLAGSILAYFEITKRHRSQNNTLNLILPFIGLILIVHSVIFFDDKMIHPSLYTLSPIIGVCLIIWFSNENELITKILSTKLFLKIGLISYSLYLWHYPIFAFYRSYASGLPIFNLFHDKILIFILVIFFSLFSYFFIEKPYRRKEIEFKKLLKLLLAKISIVILFIILSFYSKGYEFRIPLEIREILKNKISFVNIYDPIYRNCFAKFNYKTDKICKDISFKNNIYIW